MRGLFVGELLDVLPSYELTYWIEFFRREPWGTEVENQRMGQICATIGNCTPRPRGSKAFRPSDFYDAPDKRDAATERRNVIERLVRESKRGTHKTKTRGKK